MNWDRYDMVNAMSGHVPNAAYINEPMASQYGTSHMSLSWQGVVGHWDKSSLC